MNTNTETAILGTLETLEIVKENSLRASNEAFEVLANLKDGEISLPQAQEMSNAIGKVNAANGNVLKADLLALAIDKQTSAALKQLGNQQ